MKLRFHSIALILLGTVCVALILWMLFSDAVSVQTPLTNRADFVLESTDTPIDIRKFETSYWSSVSPGDTIKPGDVIRATTSGVTFINISNIAYVELTAPFEFKIVQNNQRQPIELSLLSGRIRYFYSFDDPKVPNSISTPVGRLVFAEVRSEDSKVREVIISESQSDTKIKVVSGLGNWFESGQTAVINSGEILTRNSANGELFKSPLIDAPTDFEVRVTQDSLETSWTSNLSPTGYIIRMMEIRGDTLIHNATLNIENNYFNRSLPTSGEYAVQIAYDLPEYGSGRWSNARLISID